MIDRALAEKTLRYGEFFYPARKRYPGLACVICDFCNTPNISACIGYKQYDLCLRCAHDITTRPLTTNLQDVSPTFTPRTLMQADHTTPILYMTRMFESPTRPDAK